MLPAAAAAACLSHAEDEIDRLTTGYGVGAATQLTGIGDLASRLTSWYGGDLVQLEGVPTALGGREAVAHVLWALAHVDFDGHARYWDAAMERLIGGERPTTPTDAAHVLIALHRRDALGALGEQSLQALMTSAALAGPTRHRLVRRMIEASPVPLIEPALASTAQVWQS